MDCLEATADNLVSLNEWNISIFIGLLVLLTLASVCYSHGEYYGKDDSTASTWKEKVECENEL